MPTKSELKYHIVWCTKYRRRVLTEEIQLKLKYFVREVCLKNEFELLEIETMEDHIHIFIKASGKDSVHRIVSQVKGFTAFSLRKEFPQLKSKLPCMWTRSYYAGTVGHVSEETVKKYILNQKNV